MKTSKKVGIGAGIMAAAAAAAAGAYFLYGKNGPKNRKMVKGWMLKARGEVIEKLEKLEKVSEEGYREIVDSVIKGYKSAKNATPAELAAVASELKAHWNSIKRTIGENAGGSKPRRSAGARKTANTKKAKTTTRRKSRV